jgi:DNA-directed RNA polymerase subunit F
MAQPTWLEVLQTSYIDNAEAKQLLSKLLLHPEQGIFSLVQGVIKYKGRKLGHNALL